mgnify:CR=1 FL=1
MRQIVECNTITETLVRITYLKTIYRCPTELEIEHDDCYDDDMHHQYYTKQLICIFTVHGSKYDDWSGVPQFIDDIPKGKIHVKRLNSGVEEMNRTGIWSVNTFNQSVYNTDHYHLVVTKIEMMN